ncbi:MAG: cation:proton antiporter [Desulfobacterales bacterium]|nr:cation:proton antiporter [Desulfobacterales bacterium]
MPVLFRSGLGLSVAIIEITLGTIAGNLGLKTEEWMLYIAQFGGIILTYLAGTEIDTKLFKEKFKESFLIGFFSFLAPFVGSLSVHLLSCRMGL